MFVAPFLADLNRKVFLTKRRTYEIERAAPCIVYSIGRMGGGVKDYGNATLHGASTYQLASG